MNLHYMPSNSSVHPGNASFDGHSIRLYRNIAEEYVVVDGVDYLTYNYEESVLSPIDFLVYANMKLLEHFNLY